MVVRSLALASVIGAAALIATACSSNGDTPAPPTSDDGGTLITCQNDPRADTFVAKLERTGAAATMKFSLVAGDPAPPTRGINKWRVSITDMSGTAVPAATVTAKPFMPDHGHGTSIRPVVTPDDAGSYAIDPLYFFMPGLWQVTLDVQNGAAKDSVVYTFCVPG